MRANRVDVITMGCSKNLVDSELLMKQLDANGFECVHDSDNPEGDIVVVNIEDSSVPQHRFHKVLAFGKTIIQKQF